MEPKEWLKIKRKIIQKNKMQALIQEAFLMEQKMLKTLSKEEVYDYMICKLNYCQRKQYFSSKDLHVRVVVGDICFIDFGNAYINEIGYLHFGLVLSIVHTKAFVVPMSGNQKTYQKADKDQNIHTYALPCIEGLNKPSVLFLNDVKWINTARVIDRKAHIDPNGALFQTIKKRIKLLIDGN